MAILKTSYLSILISEMELTGINKLPYHYLPCFINKLLRYSLLKLSACQRKRSVYDVMKDFKLLLVCGIVLSLAIPVQNFIIVLSLMTQFFVFLMFLFCIFLDKRRRFQFNDVIIYDVISFMQVFFHT